MSLEISVGQPQGEADGLVERLRDFRCANCGWEGVLTNEAADTITAQAAEIEALRERVKVLEEGPTAPRRPFLGRAAATGV